MDRVEKRAPWRDHENWRDSARSRAMPGFGELHEAEFRHLQQITPEGVVQRVASVSHVAVLPDAEREAVLDEVRDGAGHPSRRPGPRDRRDPLPGRLLLGRARSLRALKPEVAADLTSVSAWSAGGPHGREHRGDGIGRAAATAAASDRRLPSAAASSSPDRGTTFVRRGRRAARRARRCCSSTAGSRAPGLNWFQVVRAAARALQHRRPRPARPRPRAADPQGLPARRLRRRLRGDARASSAPAPSSRSATRWAARSRSCCGAATATSSTASCCARRASASCRNRLTRNVYQAGDAERDRDGAGSRGRRGSCRRCRW